MPKLLVVDDDPDTLAGFVSGLKLMAPDIVVRTASNGNDARTLLSKESDIEAIVCDSRMPGLRGLDVLHWAKENGHPARRILLTGYNPAQIAQKDLERANPVTLLIKPADLKQILRFAFPGLTITKSPGSR